MCHLGSDLMWSKEVRKAIGVRYGRQRTLQVEDHSRAGDCDDRDGWLQETRTFSTLFLSPKRACSAKYKTYRAKHSLGGRRVERAVTLVQ